MTTKLLPLLLTALAACAHAPVYPPARRGDVVDDLHGVKVADPYRWMEDLDSAETRAWVAAEAKLTDAHLSKLASRAVFKRRLTRVLDFEKFDLPFHEGGRTFYSHNAGLQDQSVLEMTEGLSGAPAVALDPNALSKDGPVPVVGYVASRDGKLLAYGVAIGGSDWTEWRIRDLASGKDLPDVIRHTKYYAPAFAADGKALYYSGFPAPVAGDELKAQDLGNTLYQHALGTPPDSDRVLYQRADHPDWQFEPQLCRDGRWLVFAAGEGQVGDKKLENVYAIDLSAPRPAVLPLAEGFDAGYQLAGCDRGLFYFQTSLEAPRGRVIAIDPAAPERARWREIVPQGPDALDDHGVTLVDHQLIVRSLHDAHTRVTTYGLDGRATRELALPGLGSAHGFDGSPDDKEAFYLYQDFVTPPTMYRLDLETGRSEPYRVPKAAFDPSLFEVKQVFYPAKDGTKIPMFLVHRKGLKLDGANPTLLYGYGGFGEALTPWFSARRVTWLEIGGVIAIANIRGGGEYGEQWHQQAIRRQKQVGFDDFIAAAEWLIGQGYTSSRRLAIEGGSNGGLLVAACLTQRPELFGAVLAEVAVLDMLRFDRFGQGAGWVGDYGSPRDPEDFKALLAYSPYHHVRPGVRYPPTLLVTGDHDTRVMPAHSFKFAAALQAAQARSAPVLMRVELASGHMGGTVLSQVIDQYSDMYAFLVESLGMEIK